MELQCSVLVSEPTFIHLADLGEYEDGRSLVAKGGKNLGLHVP